MRHSHEKEEGSQIRSIFQNRFQKMHLNTPSDPVGLWGRLVLLSLEVPVFKTHTHTCNQIQISIVQYRKINFWTLMHRSQMGSRTHPHTSDSHRADRTSYSRRTLRQTGTHLDTWHTLSHLIYIWLSNINQLQSTLSSHFFFYSSFLICFKWLQQFIPFPLVSSLFINLSSHLMPWCKIYRECSILQTHFSGHYNPGCKLLNACRYSICIENVLPLSHRKRTLILLFVQHARKLHWISTGTMNYSLFSIAFKLPLIIH